MTARGAIGLLVVFSAAPGLFLEARDKAMLTALGPLLAPVTVVCGEGVRKSTVQRRIQLPGDLDKLPLGGAVGDGPRRRS